MIIRNIVSHLHVFKLFHGVNTIVESIMYFKPQSLQAVIHPFCTADTQLSLLSFVFDLSGSVFCCHIQPCRNGASGKSMNNMVFTSSRL